MCCLKEEVISRSGGGASRMYSSDGGNVSDCVGSNGDKPIQVVGMLAAPIKWLKTDLPPLKDLPSLKDQLELVDSRVDNINMKI